jgi:hypothetical protein
MKLHSLTPTKFVFAALLAAGAALLHAESAWLPPAGELTLTPSYVYQYYDTFRLGTAKVTLPANIVQQTESLAFDYGIAPNLALDATLGYTGTRFKPPGAKFTREGLDDSRLGLRYRFIDETAVTPAFAFRVGAIIAGNYDVPNTLPPINPGDKASGFETSISTGKTFGETGFGFYGEAGYRNRNHNVPDDLFGGIGLFKHFGSAGLNVGFRHTQGLSGGDIAGTGFGTSYGFPQVKETVSFIDTGLSYTDRGGRTYQFVAAWKVGRGRNTGDATVFGFSVGIPLRLTR